MKEYVVRQPAGDGYRYMRADGSWGLNQDEARRFQSQSSAGKALTRLLDSLAIPIDMSFKIVPLPRRVEGRKKLLTLV